MKLYTEEQVKNFLKERTFIREETIDAMCESLTPIEIPSDEDIQNLIGFACKTPNTAINGAKWMKEIILNQSK